MPETNGKHRKGRQARHKQRQTQRHRPSAPENLRVPAVAWSLPLLLIISAVAFWPLLISGLVWTPYDSVVRSIYPQMDSWTEAWQVETVRQHDPVSLSTYALESTIPLPLGSAQRLINLLLHGCAALLLLRLLRVLNIPGAWAAALIFAVHPIVFQTLFWSGYRSQIIALMVLLGAIYLGLGRLSVAGYIGFLLLGAAAPLLHPIGYLIPILLGLALLVEHRKPPIDRLNRILPLVVYGLLVVVWSSSGSSNAGPGFFERADRLALNWIFYLRETVLPLAPSLFHTVEPANQFSVGGDLRMLPLLVFIPLLTIGVLRYERRWARTFLFGVSALLLISLVSASDLGAFVDGAPAIEDHQWYPVLPVFLAMICAAASALLKRIGRGGRILGAIALTSMLLFLGAISMNQALRMSNSGTVWRSLVDQWPDSAQPKLALIHLIETEPRYRDLLTEDQKIVMQTELLEQRPELIEERVRLARMLRDVGQWNNALVQFRRILRETEPDLDFLREAVRFFEQRGLDWEANNVRERIANRSN
jgi:hypothetical protein